MNPDAPSPTRGAHSISETAQAGEQRTALMGLLVNVCQFPFSLYAAWVANSLALWADFAIVVSDTTTVLAAWLTLRAFATYDRRRYNFGLGKLESLTAFGVAAGQCVSLTIIVFGAIRGLLEPEPLEGQGFGLIVVAASFFVYGYLFLRAFAQWRRDPAPVIESQWRLYLINVGQAVVIIVPLGLAWLLPVESWTFYLDPVASFLLSGFMIYHIVHLVRGSFYDIIDRAAEPAALALVERRLAEHGAHVHAVHEVRSRRSGRRVFIEVLAEFAPDVPMGAVQATIDEVSARLEAELDNAHVYFIARRRGPPAP
ncbi:MAG: cation diffusion facilitator family transporter [Alphaproteobacteria bacterium]|nr:cation diffusion facilitator family transporter [Alphaproteobacteria bacterium]